MTKDLSPLETALLDDIDQHAAANAERIPSQQRQRVEWSRASMDAAGGKPSLIFRKVDAALQKLRRAGLIKFVPKTGWQRVEADSE